MADAVYKVTEVVGTSTDSIHQAVRNGVARAAQTLRNLDWFEVTEIRSHITNNDEIGHFQVTTHARFGEADEVICDVAESVSADLIVVGNRGMKRRFLGSVPNSIAHHAHCSVLIVHTTEAR